MDRITSSALAVSENDDAVHSAMIDQARSRLPELMAAGRDAAAHAVAGPHLDALDSAVQSLPDRARSAVVDHPLFSHWSTRLATKSAGPRWLLELGRLLLGPHLREGSLPASGLFLPLDNDGRLQGPALRPVQFSRKLAGDVVHVTTEQTAVSVQPSRPHRGLIVPHLLDAHPWRPAPDVNLTIDAADPWLIDFLAAVNRQPRTPSYPERDIEPVVRPDEGLRETYSAVLALLHTTWPEEYAEVVRYVTLVVPFRSKHLVGWSTPMFQGAAFIRADPGNIVFTFERLVHEAAHQRLFAIQRFARLHTDPPGRTLASALRRDPRPTSGVYHAAFVCGRLVQAFRRVLGRDADSQWDCRLHDIETKYRSLSTTLHQQASLTPLGEDMLANLDELVRAGA